MDAREFFGDAFFERAEPETFPTFEQWVYMHTVEERRAIESLIRESVSTRVDAPAEVPSMPSAVPANESIAAAWRAFHGSPRALRESGRLEPRRSPRSPRSRAPRPGAEDPSAWPDDLRP